MTKKLSWRLSRLPTPDEVRELVKDKIITQEEARDILFSHEETEPTNKGLESEIKFLRELVEKLSSNNRTTIIETIKQVERPNQPWFNKYDVWCQADNRLNSLLAQQCSAVSLTKFSSIT